MHLQTSEITLEIWQKNTFASFAYNQPQTCSDKRDKNASWAPKYIFMEDVKIDDIFNLFFFIESFKEKYFSYELRAFFSSKYYQYVMNPSKKQHSHTKCVFATLIVRFLHEYTSENGNLKLVLQVRKFPLDSLITFLRHSFKANA